MLSLLPMLWLLSAPTGPVRAATPARPEPRPTERVAQGKPFDLTLVTDLGDVVLELDPALAPGAIEAWVGWVSGEKGWFSEGKAVQRPLLDGTIFHRVIPGFAVQGGDPLGTGLGNAGLALADGTLDPAQANQTWARGSVGLVPLPTGGFGSQFILLLGDAPWLQGRCLKVGQVVAGQEVLAKLAEQPRGPLDRPLSPVHVRQVKFLSRPSASSAERNDQPARQPEGRTPRTAP